MQTPGAGICLDRAIAAHTALAIDKALSSQDGTGGDARQGASLPALAAISQGAPRAWHIVHVHALGDSKHVVDDTLLLLPRAPVGEVDGNEPGAGGRCWAVHGPALSMAACLREERQVPRDALPPHARSLRKSLEANDHFFAALCR